MTLFTIGFTHKSAAYFFSRLEAAGVRQVIDVRLSNGSQLSGFSKRDDLAYFLSVIAGIGYAHHLELAPTHEMLNAYKKRRIAWSRYESEFLDLMKERRVETTLAKSLLDGACLLCSEDEPHHCHRRLVAEYLQRAWGSLTVEHLT